MLLAVGSQADVVVPVKGIPDGPGDKSWLQFLHMAPLYYVPKPAGISGVLFQEFATYSSARKGGCRQLVVSEA